jgi:hypothetical protein
MCYQVRDGNFRKIASGAHRVGVIEKLKFPTLLLLLGALLTAASLLTGLDPKNFHPDTRSNPALTPLLLGVALVIVSALLFLMQEGLLPAVGIGFVRRAGNGLTTFIGQSRVTLRFGRLEESVPTPLPGEKQMVLLPANEFFDDDCFKATGTACGAYLTSKAASGLERLRKQVTEQLKNMKTVGEFETKANKLCKSYGAGACLFLEFPAGLSHSLVLAAVAEKRPSSGFQSNPSYLFQVIERTAEIATDHRIVTVCTPLLGAGKGGLSPEESLMTMLLSISTMQRRLGGFDAAIDIIVFKPAPGSKPVISKKAASRILSLASSMHRRGKAD